MKTLETTTTREERMEIYNKIREDYDKMEVKEWAEHLSWINNLYSGEEHQQGIFITNKRDFILERIGIDINEEDFYEEFEEGFDPWSLAPEKNREWLDSLESEEEKYEWVNGKVNEWNNETLSSKEIDMWLGDIDFEDFLNVDWNSEEVRNEIKSVLYTLGKGGEDKWKMEEREMKLCDLIGGEYKPSEEVELCYFGKIEEEINETMSYIINFEESKSLEGIIRDMLFYYCFL